MVSAKARAAAKATWRGVKKAAKTKQGRKITAEIKSQAEESFRKKMAEVPLAGVLGTCLKLASDFKTPMGTNGKNLNDTSARDVSIIGSAKGDVTTSSSMYAYRPPRKRKLEGVNYVQKTRAAATKTASVGSQNHWDISVLDAVPVLNNPDSNDKYTNLSIKKAFNDFLIASNQGTDELKRQQTSIHMKSLSCELNITNNNDTACILDIWEVLPKHTLGPTDYANDGYATGYMSPSWTWAQGLATDTPMLEDTLASGTAGSKPFDSVNFSRTWNVVKHVKANITANSTHIHKMAYAINKTVTYQEYAQFSTSGGKLAGWNPTFLMRLRGVPDATNPVASAGSVTYYADMQLNYSGYMSEGARAIVFDDKT